MYMGKETCIRVTHKSPCKETHERDLKVRFIVSWCARARIRVCRFACVQQFVRMCARASVCVDAFSRTFLCVLAVPVCVDVCSWMLLCVRCEHRHRWANPPLGESATNPPLGPQCLKENRSFFVVICFQACKAVICTCNSSNSNDLLCSYPSPIHLIPTSAHYPGADDRVCELRGGQ